MRDSQHDLLTFWFTETDPRLWFQHSEAFDAMVRDRCELTYDMAGEGLCDGWKRDVEGCLALCVLLHQVPRHLFRGTAKAFGTDRAAIVTAKHALTRGFDQTVPPARRRFIYLPLLHSEQLGDQRRSLALFRTMRQDDPVSFAQAQRHHALIERFGRFPQRNDILRRETTFEEYGWLNGREDLTPAH